MTGKELLGYTSALETYLSGYDEFFRRVENRAHFRLFIRGQLGPVERKNLESIADAARVDPRPLQHFFRRGNWDHEGVRDRLQREIAESFGNADGIFVIDETSDEKQGKHTAGVARQYCGASGKVANCIVSVHLAYVRGAHHSLLDGELFLPESWNPDPKNSEVMKRRQKCEIPDDVVHESKTSISLRLLRRAITNGVPGRYVAADSLYGRSAAWRNEVASFGMVYVVEVGLNVFGWIRDPKFEVPEYSGKGRHPSRFRASTPALRLDVLLSSPRGLRFQPWQRFRVQDTDKGPEVWEFKANSFWEQGDSGKVKWLLVGRNVVSGKMKRWISNAHPGTPIEALIKIAFCRWPVERCFQECKSELGLDHAEIRTWKGLHRHFTLTSVNQFFLRTQVIGKKRNRRINNQSNRRGRRGAA